MAFNITFFSEGVPIGQGALRTKNDDNSILLQSHY